MIESAIDRGYVKTLAASLMQRIFSHVSRDLMLPY
jgi:hypothetical protein